MMVEDFEGCLACVRAKSKRQPWAPRKDTEDRNFVKAEKRPIRKEEKAIVKARENRTDEYVGARWNADWKAWRYRTHGKERGAVIHVDTVSSVMEIAGCKVRSEWVAEAKRVHALSVVYLADQRKKGLTVQIVPPSYVLDNDKAAVNAQLKEFMDGLGTRLQLSAEYTADENKKVERAIGTLHTHAMANMIGSGAPKGFILDAYYNVKYVYHRLMHRGNKGNTPPLMVWRGNPGSGTGCVPFMCLGAVHVDKKRQGANGGYASFWAWVLYREERSTRYRIWKDTDLKKGRMTFLWTKHVTLIRSVLYVDRLHMRIDGYYDNRVPPTVFAVFDETVDEEERSQDILDIDLDGNEPYDDLDERALDVLEHDPRFNGGTASTAGSGPKNKAKENKTKRIRGGFAHWVNTPPVPANKRHRVVAPR